MLKATRFMRKPFFIITYKITEENMEALAKWCKGHIVQDGDARFIRVPVNRPSNEKQTRGYVGTYLTASQRRGEMSFKVYNEDYLMNDFQEIPDFEAFDAAVCCATTATPPRNVGAHFQAPTS